MNLVDLNLFDDGATVDAMALKDKGLVPDLKLPVKILGRRETDAEADGGGRLVQQIGPCQDHGRARGAQGLTGQTFEFPKEKKKFIPREPVKKKIADEAAEGEGGPPAAASSDGEAKKLNNSN